MLWYLNVQQSYQSYLGILQMNQIHLICSTSKSLLTFDHFKTIGKNLIKKNLLKRRLIEHSVKVFFGTCNCNISFLVN